MDVFSNPRKLTLLLASTLTVMSGATIAASLPLISETFADNPDAAFLSRLVLTVPALLIAICSPLAGYLVDRVGRLRLLYVGLILYAIGGTAGGLVNSLEMILTSRAVLGLAVALVMTTSATLIADYYEGPERADLLGKQAAAQSLGGILFITAGGVLADIDWRAPFYVYLLSLLIIPMTWWTLEEPPRNSRDEPQGRDRTVKKQKSYLPVAVMLFVTIFLGMVIFYLTPVQLPFLLADLGVSSTLTGVAISSLTLSGALVSLNFRSIRDQLEPYWLLALSFIFLGIGYVVIGLASSYGVILVGTFISGLGLGVLMPNINQVLMNVAPQARRGFLLGILSSCLFLGQFVSPILAAPLIDSVGLPPSFTWVGYGSIGIGLAFAGYAVLAGPRVRG